jgi:alkylation response protein AidB-like acyl-CoA dehydrogenase
MSAAPETLDWQERCSRFAEEVMAPVVRHYDQENCFPVSVHTAAREWQLLNQDFPSALGGADLSPVVAVEGAEILARCCAPIAFTMGFNRGALHPIMVAGNAEQQQEFVGRVLREGRYASLCLTEAESSGSNLLKLSTTAERTDRGWVIRGEKVMVGNGGVATQYLVLARVLEAGRTRGLAFFVIPRTDAVQVGPNTDKLGFRAVETPTVRFNDVEVSDFHRLGTVGSGEQIVLQALDFIRVGGSAVICGIVAGALADAMTWVQTRQVYGGSLGSKSHVQIQLGRTYARLQMVRQMVRHTAAQLSAGQAYGESASVAKLEASSLAVEATAQISQLYGWRGIDGAYAIQKRLRDARQTTIFEGSSEIQALHLFRSLAQRIRSEGVP